MDERRRTIGHDDQGLTACARERDVEQTALLLDVLGQAVRVLVGVGLMNDDERPLLPLHAVHGGQRDAIGAVAGTEVLAQPTFERARVGLELGELSDGGEVVVLRSAVHAATADVERGDRRRQAHRVADGGHQSRRGGTTRGEVLQPLDVVGEGVHPFRLAVGGQPCRQPSQPVERRLLADPVGHVRVQRARRPAQGLGEVARRQRGGGRGQSQPGERGAHSGAFGELVADAAVDRQPLAGQRHLHRGEQRVDATEHRDVAGWGASGDRFLDRRGGGGNGVARGCDRPADLVGLVGADGLRHAQHVVAQQPVGGGDDAAGAAVVDLQRVILCTGEERGEVDQPGRVGPVVAVDGLVVVADAEHGAVRPGQQPHEQQVCRGEVLELVHQQHAARPLRRCPRIGVGEQQLDRALHLLVEVERSRAGELAAVLRQERGEPVDLTVVASLDVGGGAQTEAGERQRLHPRGDGVDVALARERDELADDPSHLGLVDGGPLRRTRGERRRSVDDRQRDRVERAHLQTAQVARALAHLLLCPLVEGDEADGRRRQPPDLQQLPGPLGEHPRLAGSGGRDDPRCAAAVCNGGQLIWGQLGGRRAVHVGGGEWTQRAVFDCHPVQHRRAVDRFGEADRPTVEPRGSPVGEHDVAATVVGWSSAEGKRVLQQRPPTGPGVVAVGAHEQADPLAPEAERRSQLMRLALLALRFVELHRRRVVELEHGSRAGARQRFELVGDRVRPIQRDRHARCIAPVLRCRIARPDDDVAPEHHRPAPDRPVVGDRRTPRRARGGSRNGFRVLVGLERRFEQRLHRLLDRVEQRGRVGLRALPAGAHPGRVGVAGAAVHTGDGHPLFLSQRCDAGSPASPSDRSGSLECGEHAGPAVGVGLVRGVEADPLDDVAVALVQLRRDLLGLADDGEGVEDFVVDEPAHLHPLALLGQPVELVLQPAPAVQLEHRTVRRCRPVEGDLLACPGCGLGQLGLGAARDDEARPDDLEALHRLARLGPTALQGRQGDFAEVALGRESVADEPVADLTGHFRHQLTDTGEEDLRHAEPSQLGSLRREERGHQRMRVEVAAEGQRRAVLPRVPDGPDGQDHLPHAGRRVAPLHAEPLGDVRFDLTAETEHETTLGERLQVPAGVGQRHRVAGERHRDRRAELDRLGVLGTDQQREERVVRRLRGPHAAVPGGFGLLGLSACLVQIESDATIDLHVRASQRRPIDADG